MAVTSTTLKTDAYVAIAAISGTAILLSQFARWHTADATRFLFYLLIAVFFSGCRLRLPGLTGRLSANFLILLVAISALSLPEVLATGAAGALSEAWRRRAERVSNGLAAILEMSVNTLAIYCAHHVYQHPSLISQGEGARLFLTTVTLFAAHTTAHAAVEARIEGRRRRTRDVWDESHFWTLPYYIAGAFLAGVFNLVSRELGWQTSALLVPVAALLRRAYKRYQAEMEGQKASAQQMASLHLRTIESLAMAIEAKDYSRPEHLRRVKVYALEIARQLKLSEADIDGIRAAALLHDVGKLAIPDHIISKPGRLTREEFEKVKIHPLVGAEILERVQFPYPVAPIVRAHHERWDGTGYPLGLKGEEIPIGARILAAVDCLDALVSDRQYRKALTLDQAIQVVAEESGRGFDPVVVEVLRERLHELEKMASAGRAEEHVSVSPAESDFLGSIAAARREAQALYELAQDLGQSLSLRETLTVIGARLQRMVPYDALAIYIVEDGRLRPERVVGEDSKLFSKLRIPLGAGISGWVAENRRPIVNGNPSVEPGYLNDPEVFSILGSALSVPLDTGGGAIGVLTLYRRRADGFTRDDLRVLLSISSKLSLSVENALKYQQAESSATRDFLTGLPNSRSLFQHLEGEFARCRRTGNSVTVLVCDLNGFKNVNDRFGHLTGNDVLRRFAAGMRAVCREYDYVARLGGDEFVVVLPGVTREAVKNRARQLDDISRLAGMELCGEPVVSLSVGEACFPADGENAEQVLAEADRRMYVDKCRKRGGHMSHPDAGAGGQPAFLQ